MHRLPPLSDMFVSLASETFNDQELWFMESKGRQKAQRKLWLLNQVFKTAVVILPVCIFAFLLQQRYPKALFSIVVFAFYLFNYVLVQQAYQKIEHFQKSWEEHRARGERLKARRLPNNNSEKPEE